MKHVGTQVCKDMLRKIKCGLVILLLIPCTQTMAQSTIASRQLTSFCGFKAGEQKTHQKILKGNDQGLDTVRARASFRKFRDVRLFYSPKGRLQTVEAFTFIERMNKEKGRKELEACCAEFTKYGISWSDWQIENDGNKLQRTGTGRWVQIEIMGDFASVESSQRGDRQRKGTYIEISVAWEGIDLETIVQRPGKYTARSGCSRKEFIERSFGVKFGAEIPDKIKNGCERDIINAINGYMTRLTSSINEMDGIVFHFLDGSHRLTEISLHGLISLQRSDDLKRRYSMFCREVKDWLGIESYSSVTKDKVPANGSVELTRMTSMYNDDGITISVCGIFKSTQIDIDVKIAARATEAEIEEHAIAKAADGETEKHMKEIIIPTVAFRPPATIVDAVEYLRQASRNYDRPNVPTNKRGVNFMLRLNANQGKIATIPCVEASNISLWNALNLICKSCGYKFNADNKVVYIDSDVAITATTEKDEIESRMIEKRMREIIIPNVAFRPPATIVDATMYFRQASRDFDRPDIPINKRGVNFMLRLNENQKEPPTVPSVSVSNVSLWDALHIVCKMCGFKFKVADQAVQIEPQ